MVTGTRTSFPVTKRDTVCGTCLGYPWTSEKFIVDIDPISVKFGGVLSQVKYGSELLWPTSAKLCPRSRGTTVWSFESCCQLWRLLSSSTSTCMDQNFTYAPKTLPLTGCWTLGFWRGGWLDGFSICRSTTSHLKTVKAWNTPTYTHFLDDNAQTSVPLPKYQTSGRRPKVSSCCRCK